MFYIIIICSNYFNILYDIKLLIAINIKIYMIVGKVKMARLYIKYLFVNDIYVGMNVNT